MARKNIFQLLQFEGLDVTASEIARNERNLRKAINVIFTKEGALKKANGYKTIGEVTDTGVNGIYGITTYQKLGIEERIIVTYLDKISLFDINATSPSLQFLPLTLPQVIFSNTHYFFTQYRDLLFMTNGVNKGMKYDGEKVTFIGVPSAPAPTLTLQTGGKLVAGNTYNYLFSYISEYNTEGNTYSTSISITPTTVEGQTVRIIMSPPPSGYAIDKIAIYRQRVNTNDTLYRLVVKKLSELPQDINGNYYYDDTGDIADDDLDTYHPYPQDNNEPKLAKLCIIHQDRLFLANTSDAKNEVIFSKLRNVEQFPIWNMFRVGDETEKIYNLTTYQGNLYIYTNKAKYVLLGVSEADYTLQKVSDIQLVSPYAVCKSENYLLEMATDGVYVFDGSRELKISESVTPIIMEEVNIAEEEICLFYNNHYLYIAYPESGIIKNNKILVCDLNNFMIQKGVPKWTTFDKPGINQFLYLSSQNIILATSSIDGKIYHFNKEGYYQQDEQDMLFEFETDYFDMNAPILYKVFRYIDIIAESTDVDLYISCDIDYKTIINFILSNIPIYGDMWVPGNRNNPPLPEQLPSRPGRWSEKFNSLNSKWAYATTQLRRASFTQEAIGKQIAIKVKNVSKKDVIINGLALIYYPKSIYYYPVEVMIK